MNDVVQTILDVADGGVKYNTEKLPKIKIKEQSPMPSLSLLGVVAVFFVLMFCVFSTVQMIGIKSDVSKLREQKTELREDVDMLEGIYQTRAARINSSEEMFAPMGK